MLSESISLLNGIRYVNTYFSFSILYNLWEVIYVVEEYLTDIHLPLLNDFGNPVPAGFVYPNSYASSNYGLLCIV